MSEKISKISVDNVVYDLSVDMSSVDAKVSELENKISEGDAGLQENIDNLAEKVESEATRVDGMVNQINENVASSIETLNNNLVQAIETINGGIAAEVTNREEGDKALQASIDELAEKINGESSDLSELEGKVEKNAADIATVNSNLVEAVNNINKNMADGFNTINGGINNEIRPELEKAVKYEDTATEQNPGRKTIFLNNHDNICGKTTDGGSVNIAMVSKWNKVNLGSTAIELNLNGSAEHPTYNDSKEIAFLEDVQGSMETIALVKKDDLTYELQVGDKIAGTINIPADQFLKSVEYSADDKSLTFVFNTAEGEQTSVVDLSSLVDTYVAGSGIELAGNAFSVKLDPASEVYLSVSEAGIKVEGIDAIKKDIQEVSANLSVVDKKIEEEIRPELEKAVKYVDIADENLPEHKAIVLKNGDVILGEKVEGGSSSLVQLNRWGVADFGSASVPFNINTPKDVRPTVQEAGQSGEEAHKIAYLSDVESSSAQIEEVKAALETKADKADVDSAVENINSALDQKADKIAVDAITEQLATKADAESVDNRFATVNEGLDSKADKIAVDAITEKVDGISADLEGVVKYQEFGEGRKTIQLSNYDNISGIDTKGEGHNLVMLSKWDKADFGAPGVELNLNGSADRPTYNNTKEIALTEDIEAAKEGLISYKVLEDGSKTIELANGDSLSGVNAEGVAGLNLAKVSADDKVEVGSAGLTLNLVGAAPRPVFNGEKGIALSEDLETRANELQDEINLKASQSDLEAYMSATNTKIEEFEGKIGTIPTKVSEFENDADYQNASQVDARIQEVVAAAPEALDTLKELADALGNDPDFAGTVTTELAKKANSIDVYTKEEADAKFITEHQSLEGLNATVQILQSKVDALTKTNTEVVSVDSSAGELKDSSKDYIVSGSINENAEIVGKSISLKSIKVSDNARLKLNAGDVEAKDLNISGSFPKANGNTVISVDNAEFIVFKDMVFDASEVYNGIEIGLASNSVLPKNILFDNCKFQGEFSNNAILVFGTQDNAIITLNNCYSEKISNALRISNKMNAKGVVVNINNCTVDQWDTRAPWQGFLILEDYTSKSDEEALANNLFAPEKITINFNNLVYQGKKVMPEDVASVCGTKDENQVVYVCIDSASDGNYVVAYDKNRYPTINFN